LLLCCTWTSFYKTDQHLLLAILTRAMSRRKTSRAKSSKRQQSSPFVSESELSDLSGFDKGTFGSAEDQPLVLDNNDPSVAPSTSSKGSRFIPINFKQQLAIDLLAAGGINNAATSFAAIADSNPTYYGKVGTKERRKGENLVQRWKTSQRAEYNQYALGQLQTQPPAIVQATDPAPSVQRQATVPQLSLPSPPTSSTVPRSPPLARLQSPSLSSPSLLSPNIRPFVPQPSIMASGSEKLTLYLSKADEEIEVSHPICVEKHKPFRIIQRESYKNAEGVVANVYIITLADLDPRWLTISPPPFELFHIVGTNECVAKIAAFDYPYLHDVASEEKAKQKSFDQGDWDAINIARNQVLANPERQYKYYKIRFVEILDNNVFSPNAVEGKVKPKTNRVIGKWTETKKDPNTGQMVQEQCTSNRMYIEWKIAVHEHQKRHTSAFKQNTNDLMDAAAEEFGSMSLS